MNNTNNADNTNLFNKTLPQDVTWNQLFSICQKAKNLSTILDAANSQRVRSGRKGLVRLTEAHNRLCAQIFTLLDSSRFEAFAAAQGCDLSPHDMVYPRYATHPARF